MKRNIITVIETPAPAASVAVSQRHAFVSREMGVAEAHARLTAFAAGPAPAPDSAGPRLHLVAADRHLVIHRSGDQMILEEGSSFTFVTADQIIDQLAAYSSAEPVFFPTSAHARPAPAERGRFWLLAAVAALFLLPLPWGERSSYG
jgi:hypothetical protein